MCSFCSCSHITALGYLPLSMWNYSSQHPHTLASNPRTSFLVLLNPPVQPVVTCPVTERTHFWWCWQPLVVHIYTGGHRNQSKEGYFMINISHRCRGLIFNRRSRRPKVNQTEIQSDIEFKGMIRYKIKFDPARLPWVVHLSRAPACKDFATVCFATGYLLQILRKTLSLKPSII